MVLHRVKNTSCGFQGDEGPDPLPSHGSAYASSLKLSSGPPGKCWIPLPEPCKFEVSWTRVLEDEQATAYPIKKSIPIIRYTYVKRRSDLEPNSLTLR